MTAWRGELVIYENESRVAAIVFSRVLPTFSARLKECGHGRGFLAGEFVEYTTIIDATGQKCHVQCCYTAQCLKWLPSCRIYIPSLCFSSAQPPCVLSTRSSRPSTFFSLIPLSFSSTSLTFPLPSLRLNMRLLFTLFSLVASACAYQIITPGNSAGWTTGGRNNVSWQRVSTDQATFTMLLVNQVRSPSLSRPFSPS
jgi:hypothetical protein